MVWHAQSIVKINQIYFDNIDIELIDNFVQNQNSFIYRLNQKKPKRQKTGIF